MFQKAKRFNHQLVQFKIKSTLLNIDAKVMQKNKKQYDVIYALQKFSTKRVGLFMGSFFFE